MRFTGKQSLLKTKIATTCGSYYYDYQLSKARRSFGDKVSGLEITVLPRTTFFVSNGNNTVARFAAIGSFSNDDGDGGDDTL